MDEGDDAAARASTSRPAGDNAAARASASRPADEPAQDESRASPKRLRIDTEYTRPTRATSTATTAAFVPHAAAPHAAAAEGDEGDESDEGDDDDKQFAIKVIPGSNVHSSSPISNPFKGPYGYMYRQNHAIIVTGYPGIGKLRALSQLETNAPTGKTLFLAVIYHLRAMANLPTLYMAWEQSALLFLDQAHMVIMAKDLDVVDRLPPETWFLIDSNEDFLTPPPRLKACGNLIVQAASPRSDRMNWMKDATKQTCVMQPWSITELYCGYVLVMRMPDPA
jgi:hypothetical protein